jgi:hypothetical protein
MSHVVILPEHISSASVGGHQYEVLNGVVEPKPEHLYHFRDHIAGAQVVDKATWEHERARALTPWPWPKGGETGEVMEEVAHDLVASIEAPTGEVSQANETLERIMIAEEKALLSEPLKHTLNVREKLKQQVAKAKRR